MTCPTLPVWNDILGSTDAVSMGTSINVSCSPGFGLAHNTSLSSIVVVCDRDAHWHPVNPVCIRKLRDIL